MLVSMLGSCSYLVTASVPVQGHAWQDIILDKAM
jgi:hypothetical protein